MDSYFYLKFILRASTVWKSGLVGFPVNLALWTNFRPIGPKFLPYLTFKKQYSDFLQNHCSGPQTEWISGHVGFTRLPNMILAILDHLDSNFGHI